MRIGFDSERYISMQSQHIDERRKEIGGKLYLEMGGKLFDDYHASRVLPGFTPDNKISMLERLRDEMEIVIAINAKDLSRQKIRADLGIPYEQDVLRLVDVFRERGFLVENIVLTQMEDDNHIAQLFKERLERSGLKVARHRTIPGYPSNTELIVSEEGFGRNDYVETTRNLVVVTAPGPGSGKLATCLSQIYHEYQRGIKAGYAKFETFPVWNLPLDHPVNLAYEAATADLDDVNMIDPFHLQAYGKQAVNYNRDVEVFPLLRSLLEQLAGACPYQSPTDMGVNMAGFCISDDLVCQEAAKQEVVRRYYHALANEAATQSDPSESHRIAMTMAKLGITKDYRLVVRPALNLEAETGAPAAAMQLSDGRIVTGKTSPLLGCCSAMLLNALKLLAGIDEEVQLLAPSSIKPIQTLKVDHLGALNPRLHTDEVLIALSVSADTDENARKALGELAHLRDCEVHTTTILGSVDTQIFRNLGLQVTSEPVYARKTLFKK
ncbi:DUF1846 domain-containing protein [Varibaculum cambriense]|uniref:UPF0371 protein CJ240_04845 n=1 Tax=Varibaculum cambriense TaxID=184870 RepID=A0ABX4UWL6_9ACTO|nr:DUF1846 domain-containing protein [Varibaculum cambriense]PMB91026.1 hypothetical protein CJ240_04845 [Varibaculum cambriense]